MKHTTLKKITLLFGILLTCSIFQLHAEKRQPRTAEQFIEEKMKPYLEDLYNVAYWQQLLQAQKFTSLEDKEDFLKEAFTEKKHTIVRKAAFAVLMESVNKLLFVLALTMIGLLIKNIIAENIWDNISRFFWSFVSMFGLFFGLIGGIGIYIYFPYVLKPADLYDYKEAAELILMKLIARGADNSNIYFFKSKLMESWNLPENSKFITAEAVLFEQIVTPLEKKQPTYAMKAFKKDIENYPKKTQKELEYAYLLLFIKMLANEPCTIALLGEPGMGKTYAGWLLIKNLQAIYINVGIKGGTSKDLFGEKEGVLGALTEATIMAKKQTKKNGHMVLCLDDVDRLINKKDSDITDFLQIFDPTNLTYNSGYFLGAQFAKPKLIIITGNYELKDSAFLDRVDFVIHFDEAFQGKGIDAIGKEYVANMLKSIKEKGLFSKLAKALSLDERTLKDIEKEIQQEGFIKKGPNDFDHKNISARVAQREALKLYLQKLKNKHEKKDKIAHAA